MEYNKLNDKLLKWEKSSFIVEKGVYVIVFDPPKNIYEVRNLKSKPFKKHLINKGEIVLKPGKFLSGLKGRITSKSGYVHYWKFSDEIQNEKRTFSDCFYKSAEVYLIKDLSGFDNDFVDLIEAYLKMRIKDYFVLEPQEARKSEYYRLIEPSNDIASILTKLSEDVGLFVSELKVRNNY